MPLIETKDLIGDQLDLTVAEDFHRICTAPFVVRWMDDWGISLDTVRGLLQYFMQGYEVRDPEQKPFLFGIWHKETGAFIGVCGFGPKEELGGEAEIAYFLDEAYAHRGYMSQFVEPAISYYFDMTGKPYLCALVDERNVPSKRLLEKMGFVYCKVDDPTGRLKSHYRLYHSPSATA